MPSTQLAQQLNGCHVFDMTGRSLGTIVAIIHHQGGADVLLEIGHWWWKKHYRFHIDSFLDAPNGDLILQFVELVGRNNLAALRRPLSQESHEQH